MLNLTPPGRAGKDAPELIAPETVERLCQTTPTSLVGDDAALERSIVGCGEQVLAWMALYEDSSCLAHRGAASFWLLRMRDLIGQRAAADVARLERARGLQ